MENHYRDSGCVWWSVVTIGDGRCEAELLELIHGSFSYGVSREERESQYSVERREIKAYATQSPLELNKQFCMQE